MHTLHPNTKTCIEKCSECYQVCTRTFAHCISMGEKHIQPQHLTLLQDCAKICKTSMDFMLRGSENEMEVCKVCAEICDACAASCHSVDSEDEAMQKCADVCNTCSATCRSM